MNIINVKQNQSLNELLNADLFMLDHPNLQGNLNEDNLEEEKKYDQSPEEYCLEKDFEEIESNNIINLNSGGVILNKIENIENNDPIKNINVNNLMSLNIYPKININANNLVFDHEKNKDLFLSIKLI